jgi:Fe-S cluster assembly iron-binding protein IscA
LALDAQDNEDQTFTEGGFDFCINGELLNIIGGATIDLTYTGLMVNPAIPLQSDGASSCGGCTGSAGCGA